MPYRLSYIKELKSKILFVILSGAFLFVVLYIYQAYDVPKKNSFSGHPLFIRTLAFALCTSLSIYICEFFLEPRLSLEINNLKIMARPVWVGLEIIVGTSINFLLFNVFWNWVNMSWSGYYKMVFEYTGVFMIPYSISFVYQLYLDSQKKLKNLNTNLKNDFFVFRSNNSKEELLVNKNDLLYIKSEDNYIKIIYLNKGVVISKILRNTLQSVELQYKLDKAFVRCHRSYLVNLNNVASIHRKGGLITLIVDTDNQIPVSAKYNQRIEKKIEILR